MATNIPTTPSTVLKHNWDNKLVTVPIVNGTTSYIPLTRGLVPKTTMELFKFLTPLTLTGNVVIDIFKAGSGVDPATITPGATNRLFAQTTLNASHDLGVQTAGDVTAANEGTNVLSEGEVAWMKIVPATGARAGSTTAQTGLAVRVGSSSTASVEISAGAQAGYWAYNDDNDIGTFQLYLPTDYDSTTDLLTIKAIVQKVGAGTATLAINDLYCLVSGSATSDTTNLLAAPVTATVSETGPIVKNFAISGEGLTAGSILSFDFELDDDATNTVNIELYGIYATYTSRDVGTSGIPGVLAVTWLERTWQD